MMRTYKTKTKKTFIQEKTHKRTHPLTTLPITIILLLLFALLFAPITSASPLSIILKSPANGITSTSYRQDFIFSFDEYPEVINCSLYIDGYFKDVRNSLLTRENNKMSADLEAGKHEWFIKCYDNQLKEIISATQTFTIKENTTLEASYTQFSNTDGSITYTVSIKPGMNKIELPAAKGGDEIKILLKGKTYYIDVVRVGSSTDYSFADIRNRIAGRMYSLRAGTGVEIDFDKDGVNDTGIYLKEVQRNKDAYFTIIPYPNGLTIIQQEEIPETTITPIQQEQEERITEEAEETQKETSSSSEKPKENTEELEGKAEQATQESSTKQLEEVRAEAEESSLLPIILIIAIVIVITLIAIVILIKKKKTTGSIDSTKNEARNKTEQKTEEPQTKPEIIKSIGKKPR